MTTRFERQLEELHVQMITMGSLCEKVITLSAQAIRGKDCAKEAVKATLYEGTDGVTLGIKNAVTQRMQKELQSQTVDALIGKIANLKTP